MPAGEAPHQVLETADGFPVWTSRAPGVEIRFTGREQRSARRSPREAIARQGLEVAWAEQTHSATIVRAAPGRCGRGDALVTARTGLALAVTTADCLPVVVASETFLAVAHAGWRGIAAGIIPKVVRAIDGRATAWIGPAIGPCCYEVDDDVATKVMRASSPRVRAPGPGDRRHLDLLLAVEIQLEEAGISDTHRVGPCTRCNPDLLWSYRRDGAAAGRNWTFAWLG